MRVNGYWIFLPIQKPGRQAEAQVTFFQPRDASSGNTQLVKPALGRSMKHE